MNQVRRLLLLLLLLSLLIAVPALAAPGKPDFREHIYADGVAWGTKVTGPLPAPKGNNSHSFDKFFVFTNGAQGQLPVGEAAPRNPAYNGGRWVTFTATWIEDLPHPKVVLTSYTEEYADDPFNSIEFHYNLGHIMLTKGSPDAPGAPPPYFECPLLPVLE